MRHLRLRLGLTVILSLLSCTTLAAPQRLVSLNLCTDQLLLMLVPTERIRLLSQLAVDPGLSFMSDAAASISRFDGTVEAVIRQRPDLILAGRHAASSSVLMLERLGYRVEQFDMPESIDGTRVFIERVALVVGERKAGEGLLRKMNDLLTTTRKPSGSVEPLALLYLPNGLSAGTGTLKHELMRHVGLRNLAEISGISGYGSIGLESVVRSAPQLLLFDAAELQAPSMARALLGHPALAAMRMPVVAVPTSHWICPGPMIASAAQHLSAARATLLGYPELLQTTHQ